MNEKRYKYEVSYRASIGKGVDGKYHYKRFTGYSNTSEAKALEDAKKKAMKWLAMHKDELKNHNTMKLKDAYAQYIQIKGNVLSPSTVAEYVRASQRDFSELMDLSLSEINQTNVQSAVNVMSATHSPKSVRNSHGLLCAVLKMFAPDIHLNTRMPQRTQFESYLPSSDDIKRLMNAVAGSEIEKAILLAAFGSLRRSECCALTVDDVEDTYIIVRKALVQSIDCGWVLKGPKSEAGYRKVDLPKFVMDKLRPSGQDGKIVSLSPRTLTNDLQRILKSIGLPRFRFHDLRHYQASILHAIGVPDQYIMARGGWKTDSTLKNIYRHTMDEKRKEVENQICDYFTENFGQCDGSESV